MSDDRRDIPQPGATPPLLRSSPELVLCVTDQLSAAQSACLLLTCKRFYGLMMGRRRWRHVVRNSDESLGEDDFSWAVANERDDEWSLESTGRSRAEFLRLLERDLPDHFACIMGCGILHRSDPGVDRAFGCKPGPRPCEIRYMSGLMLTGPEYMLSSAHVHRVQRWLQTGGRSGQPPESLAASTPWTQGDGSGEDDDPDEYNALPWRKLLVEPRVDPATGHLLIHMVQRCWMWYTPFGEEDDDQQGAVGKQEAREPRRWPWWFHQITAPCIHMERNLVALRTLKLSRSSPSGGDDAVPPDHEAGWHLQRTPRPTTRRTGDIRCAACPTVAVLTKIQHGVDAGPLDGGCEVVFDVWQDLGSRLPQDPVGNADGTAVYACWPIRYGSVLHNLSPKAPEFWTIEQKAAFPTPEGVSTAIDLVQDAPLALP